MKKLCLSLFLLLTIGLAHAMTPKPGEDVFTLSASIKDPNTVDVEWQILPGYYLYKDRIHFSLKNPKSATMGAMIFPTGEKKFDQELGHYEIYRKQLRLALPLLGEQQGDSKVLVRYQGCAESGFCYPPMTKVITVHFSHELAANRVAIEQHIPKAALRSELDKTQHLLASHNIFLIIAGFFGFGLLLAMTPCVLPMIPILSGIIVGHGKTLTTRKAFFLSLTYVLSMSFTYALLGLVIAVLGANVQAALQNPYVLSGFAGLFVILALSMFGFYDIELPSRAQLWFANLSKKQHSGTYLGVFVMGMLSTLILSPCVTPPLVGTLSFIASTGSVFLGTIALFFLGLGMGLPLLLIGTSGGKLLPKAGKWMNAVKQFFGVLLLGVAILLLDRILPGQATLMLWAILFSTTGVFMGALKRMPDTARMKLSKALGLLLLVYGVLCLIGASQGNSNVFAPLESHEQSAAEKPKQITVKTLAELKRALQKAKGKPVIIDFYADWCLACKVMERTTFKDDAVKRALSEFVFLKVDVTKNDKADKELLKHFQVIAPPTFIFIDKSGQETKAFRLIGETGAKDFLKQMKRFLHQLH